MGLDMYLEARRYISPIDKETEPMRRAIEAAIGREPATEKPHGEPELLEVCAVVVRVGYWRKFWPLHNWFVNNAQEGNDDCRPVLVSAQQLEELEENLDQVEDDPDSAGDFFMDDTDEDVRLDPDEVDFTLRVIVQARKLQAQGWDIYYRGSW